MATEKTDPSTLVQYTSILKETLKDASIQVFDVSQVCLNGSNYVADLKRVTYRYKNESNVETTGTLIIKLLPPSDSPQCLIMDCLALFRNEFVAYKKILPALQRQLPQISFQIPTCYSENLDTNCLVFEDMAKNQYSLKDNKMGLSIGELKKVIKAIADLHACSHVLKSENRENFNLLSGQLHEALFSEKYAGTIFEVIWENSFIAARESLRNSGEELLHAASVFLETFEDAVLATLRKLTETTTDTFRVISHGDLWSNNILFRWDSSGVPERVCLLDFQSMRYSSCALDFLHLVCTSSQPKVLGGNLADLLQTYYVGLTESLSMKGLTPGFTQECLLEEVKNKVMFGLLLGFMMIQCSTSASQPEGFALDKDILRSQGFRKSNYDQMSEICHFRTRQLVRDLIQSGLLNIAD